MIHAGAESHLHEVRYSLNLTLLNKHNLEASVARMSTAKSGITFTSRHISPYCASLYGLPNKSAKRAVVITGLVPVIHVYSFCTLRKDVDGRVKPGHDD